jgi:transposase
VPLGQRDEQTFINYINGRQPGGGQGYLWAKHAPGIGVVYHWIANRRHENVATIVDGFRGILQSDGYAAYAQYAAQHDGVTLAACWSHTFRKFRDALTDEPASARAAMKLIGKLYELEEQWDREGIQPAERQQLRAKESVPIAGQLKAQIDVWAADMRIPKNKFREAVSYAAGQWPGLLECLKHGHTKLDTNLLESKFRAAKIGERNWMFVGHPEAGDKSAVLYTLLACCRIHRIEPRAYLTDVLERLVAAEHHPNPGLLESLLPWNWAGTHPQALVKELPRL